MPSDKAAAKGGGASKGAAPTRISADALKSDVRAFASQLGLAAAGGGGGGGDSAFSDFAPAKARQPIAKAAASKRPAGGAASDQQPGAKRQKWAGVDGGRAAAPRGIQQQQQQQGSNGRAAGAGNPSSSSRPAGAGPSSSAGGARHAGRRSQQGAYAGNGQYGAAHEQRGFRGRNDAPEAGSQADAARDWNKGIGPRPGAWGWVEPDPHARLAEMPNTIMGPRRLGLPLWQGRQKAAAQAPPPATQCTVHPGHSCDPPTCNALPLASPPPPPPGEAKGFGKSLLGKDEPAIWYEAAATLQPKLAAKPGQAGTGPVDPDLYEKRRAAAEALLEAEAAAFERDLARRNPSDAKWLQQVKRAGTSADKLAATTLLVQVRAFVVVDGEGAGMRGHACACMHTWAHPGSARMSLCTSCFGGA